MQHDIKFQERRSSEVFYACKTLKPSSSPSSSLFTASSQCLRALKKRKFTPTFILFGDFVGFVQNLRHHGTSLGIRNQYRSPRFAYERRRYTRQKRTFLGKFHCRNTLDKLENWTAVVVASKSSNCHLKIQTSLSAEWHCTPTLKNDLRSRTYIVTGLPNKDTTTIYREWNVNEFHGWVITQFPLSCAFDRVAVLIITAENAKQRRDWGKGRVNSSRTTLLDEQVSNLFFCSWMPLKNIFSTLAMATEKFFLKDFIQKIKWYHVIKVNFKMEPRYWPISLAQRVIR